MSPAQLLTDRIVPVATAIVFLAAVVGSFLLMKHGYVGASLCVGALAILFGALVEHDVQRLILNK